MEWIAEIGSAHKGIPALAHELIRQFSLAGATVCKFQLGWPREGTTLDGHRTTKDNFKRVDEWAEQLSEWCSHWGVEFMASIWSDEALDLALELEMPRLKIAHQLITNRRLIDRIIDTGKPVLFSGAISMAHNVTSLYVQDGYPIYQPRMPAEFTHGWWAGYSSHAPGIADALVAIARGAIIVEKHVTLDKTEHSVRDNHFALLPLEFAEMVRMGNEMEKVV